MAGDKIFNNSPYPSFLLKLKTTAVVFQTQTRQFGRIALKTSSWIKTPEQIRKLGGALFCDRRDNTIFVYQNGAESHYAACGFRGSLKV